MRVCGEEGSLTRVLAVECRRSSRIGEGEKGGAGEAGGEQGPSLAMISLMVLQWEKADAEMLEGPKILAS